MIRYEGNRDNRRQGEYKSNGNDMTNNNETAGRKKNNVNDSKRRNNSKFRKYNSNRNSSNFERKNKNVIDNFVQTCNDTETQLSDTPEITKNMIDGNVINEENRKIFNTITYNNKSSGNKYKNSILYSNISKDVSSKSKDKLNNRSNNNRYNIKNSKKKAFSADLDRETHSIETNSRETNSKDIYAETHSTDIYADTHSKETHSKETHSRDIYADTHSRETNLKDIYADTHSIETHSRDIYADTHSTETNSKETHSVETQTLIKQASDKFSKAKNNSPPFSLNPSDYPLSDKWVIWYHPVPSQNDTKEDWSIDSYIKIGEFKDIITFWTYYNNINWAGDNLFFLMKNEIMPLWEDIDNENGGCWCYKIKRNMALDVWTEISMVLIGNNCDNIDNINGLSISPKMNFSTIKVWVNQDSIAQDFMNEIDIVDKSKAIFKLWKDS